MLAEELNEAGLDMKAVLKPTVDIPWNTINAKEHLWKPIQEALLHKDKTSNLNTDEVTKVYEVINRHMGQKFGIHVPFPTEEEQGTYIKSLEETAERES